MQFSRYDVCIFRCNDHLKSWASCGSFPNNLYKKSGILLCSHIVTNVVFSAGHVLTVVFGMGTGVTHDRIDTGQIIFLMFFTVSCFTLYQKPINTQTLTFLLERRWSSRTFRYGYLVTTSPQLSVLPSAASFLGSLTSGITNSHGVTGGVYKTRERIHRGILIRDY